MAESLHGGQIQGEGSREPAFPAEGKACVWTGKQLSLVSHQPGTGASTSQDQGPSSTWGSSGSEGLQWEAQSFGGPRQGDRVKAGLHTTLTRKEGQRLPALLAMPESRGARGLAGGLQAQWVFPGWEGSGPGHGLGPRGSFLAGTRSRKRAMGRCLQGFPSGLRRLLHRLHKEVPVWGCPGADQPL